jgi:hypothetical protein
MNIRAAAVYALLTFVLPACASTSDTLESFVGADESALRAAWGEPDRILPNEQDGKTFVYIRVDIHSSRGGGDVNKYGSGTVDSDIPGQETRWKREFLFRLDESGRVYNADMRKEEIPVSPVGHPMSPAVEMNPG